MSGDISYLAYLESGSYLAGRRFVPGLTLVTISTLVCCSISRSNIGIEMRNHLIFPVCMGMAKAQVLKFPPAGTPSGSISFHPLIVHWCGMESAPGVQGVHLDCESVVCVCGSRTQFFQCLRKWSKHYSLSTKERYCQLPLLWVASGDSGVSADLFLGQPFELVCLNCSSWIFPTLGEKSYLIHMINLLIARSSCGYFICGYSVSVKEKI